MPTASPDACPCGRGPAFTDCCGRYTGTGLPAPDAESLMRSRYSAFVLNLTDYLLQTWHPDSRPAELTLEAGRRWLGLKLLGSSTTGSDQASVEFVARSRLGGQPAQRLHERSRFLRIDGRWLYLDGTIL